jgi:hypothetical protein
MNGLDSTVQLPPSVYHQILPNYAREQNRFTARNSFIDIMTPSEPSMYRRPPPEPRSGVSEVKIVINHCRRFNIRWCRLVTVYCFVY